MGVQGVPRQHRRHRWGKTRPSAWFLQPTLLLLLHHAPLHGYTLIEELRRFGLGDLDPSAVYRVLRDMDTKGWVSSTWDSEETQGPPRRIYRLTALGDERLAGHMREFQQTQGRIDDLVDAYSRHMEEGEGEHH